jgi:hypothetical protein
VKPSVAKIARERCREVLDGSVSEVNGHRSITPETTMSLTETGIAAPAASASPAAWAPRFLRRRPVWQACYLAGLAASVAVEIVGLVARAAGVPMRAASPGAAHAGPITVGMFAMGTMVVTFWFTFVVIAIARFAKDPARAYLRTTVPLLLVSLAMPLTAQDTAASTKAVLAVCHLLAGVVIIPLVAGRLAFRAAA